jgi:uncharacterized membrane protein (UPF0182 family)
MMKKPSPLALTFIILAVLAGAMISASGIYVDWLWFESVGFIGVWTTVLTTKIALFIVAGLITSLIITLNILSDEERSYIENLKIMCFKFVPTVSISFID